ncbi:hypothetical protein FJN13_08385 [Alteromonas mediterranea]|uniref:cold shock domain-containing protein n=1 Tax=Alteromonas mediterranea TaxID=314275 RepID=UPI00112FF600|nr:cold shock domain-containing protein [Alteromonas mediterranea]QDG34809.1 hypothetical protein FJN13_08385 [Alteromonas mediterranea]
MNLPISFFNHDAQAGGFFPQAHVGIDISGIGNRQNTLIEGIRGTGKTHILKMLKRYNLENFSNNRVLPVYVSLAQINEYVKKEADEFRVQLYARIVDACIETLESEKRYLLKDEGKVSNAFKTIWRLFGLNGETEHTNIDDSILKIKSIAEELLFKLSYDLTAEQLKSSSANENTSSNKLSAGGKLLTGLFSGNASAEDSQSKKNTSSVERSIQVMGSRLVHKNAAEFIIRFLQQIQVILDLNYSLILLDECSEASPEAQVEIFRFFKAIRGSTSIISGTEDCAFFVGSVYPKTKTNYPSTEKDGFGFEPGQDCGMEFVQWDETDIETYFEFFENMLISRASVVLGYDKGINQFIKDYFDSDDTFRLAAFCANGIPRRFWELTKRAYDHGTGQISRNRMKISVQEIVSEQILGHKTLGQNDHEVIQYVVKILTQKNEDYRVKNKTARSNIHAQGIYFSILPINTSKIHNLVMQGAIHDKSRMKSRRHSLRPHPVFGLDIAIAYTFRAIPERDFVKVARKDFPRCPANGFANAASFEPPKKRSGKDRMPSGTPTITKESQSISQNNGDNTFRSSSNLQSTKVSGVIKFFFENGYGFVSVMDGGPDAYVPRKEMQEAIALGVDLGTAVKFEVSITNRGRVATNVEIFTDSNNLLTDAMKGHIETFIFTELGSRNEIDLGNLASALRNHFGDAITGTSWLGFGKLSWLIKAIDIEGVELDTTVSPGFLRKRP